MKISDYTLAIVTDLFSPGDTMDGIQYEAECYTIVAQRSDGRRLIHFRTFLGAEKWVSDDPETYGEWGFSDTRKEAMAQAERLLARIEAKGEIDLDYWQEGEPAYGSEYYCEKYGF